MAPHLGLILRGRYCFRFDSRRKGLARAKARCCNQCTVYWFFWKHEIGLFTRSVFRSVENDQNEVHCLHFIDIHLSSLVTTTTVQRASFINKWFSRKTSHDMFRKFSITSKHFRTSHYMQIRFFSFAIIISKGAIKFFD